MGVVMQYSNFVGRVGALAVALGVGTAIATPGGVAWASPDLSGDTTASTSTATGTATGETTGTAAAPKTATSATPAANIGPKAPASASVVDPGEGPGSATTVEVAPGVTVSHSGGALTSTHGSTCTRRA